MCCLRRPWPTRPPATQVEHVVLVEQFLLLRPLRPGQAPLHVALTKQYRLEPQVNGMHHVREVETERCLVEVENLDCKLYAVFPVQPAAEGELFLLDYRSLSKSA